MLSTRISSIFHGSWLSSIVHEKLISKYCSCNGNMIENWTDCRLNKNENYETHSSDGQKMKIFEGFYISVFVLFKFHYLVEFSIFRLHFHIRYSYAHRTLHIVTGWWIAECLWDLFSIWLNKNHSDKWNSFIVQHCKSATSNPVGIA